MFLDEAGFSLALFLLYGWGSRKERLVESVPLNRGTNLSVLGAFSAAGMISQASKVGAMKRVDVERFLEFDLLPLLPAGSVLVLDNARIHHGGRIEEIVTKAGCTLLYLLYLLYLSPYPFAHLQTHQISLPLSLPGVGLRVLYGACVQETRRCDKRLSKPPLPLCLKSLHKPGSINADTR